MWNLKRALKVSTLSCSLREWSTSPNAHSNFPKPPKMQANCKNNWKKNQDAAQYLRETTTGKLICKLRKPITLEVPQFSSKKHKKTPSTCCSCFAVCRIPRKDFSRCKSAKPCFKKKQRDTKAKIYRFYTSSLQFFRLSTEKGQWIKVGKISLDWNPLRRREKKHTSRLQKEISDAKSGKKLKTT